MFPLLHASVGLDRLRPVPLFLTMQAGMKACGVERILLIEHASVVICWHRLVAFCVGIVYVGVRWHRLDALYNGIVNIGVRWHLPVASCVVKQARLTEQPFSVRGAVHALQCWLRVMQQVSSKRFSS